jgi:hypothetical protein
MNESKKPCHFKTLGFSKKIIQKIETNKLIKLDNLKAMIFCNDFLFRFRNIHSPSNFVNVRWGAQKESNVSPPIVLQK